MQQTDRQIIEIMASKADKRQVLGIVPDAMLAHLIRLRIAQFVDVVGFCRPDKAF